MLFLDDANLFCSDDNKGALFETANQELDRINDWFLANKLSLNVEKTKYILFHKLTDQDNIPLKLRSLLLNGNMIERENSLKFLSAILYEHLTWKKDTQLIENMASKMLVFFIKEVKYTLNIHEAFIYPLYPLILIIQTSHEFALIKLNLTLSFPMFPFDPRENIRKPKVFCCFQGDQKGTLGRKGLNC